jgi:hypothetical protein
VIKVDFMAAVSRLMQGDVNKLHLLNSAYITLLPKMAEALEVKDYWPISLIHSFAKIMTKAVTKLSGSPLGARLRAGIARVIESRSMTRNLEP